jgi:chromate transport protein ChrA
LGNRPLVVALFFGLKAAVLAICLEAVMRIGTWSAQSREQRFPRGRAPAVDGQ